jgi:hypothetical protein
VGASGWSYVVEYRGDPGAALAELRYTTLSRGDYFWDSVSDGHLGSRPASLAALDALRETEEFWEIGTHSVLDVDRVVPGPTGPEGTVRPLSQRETVALFGTATPTRAHFDAVAGTLPPDEGWRGVYLLLYRDGRPTEIAFWGCSGD